MRIPPDQEVLYRLPEVSVITGRRPSTIYQDMADGTFPRPVQLGEQSVAWKKSDIDRWIAERPAADPTRITTPAERGYRRPRNGHSLQNKSLAARQGDTGSKRAATRKHESTSRTKI